MTATLTGFLDGLGITNVVRVAKAKSTTRLGRVEGRLVSLRVSPAAAPPTGKVRVMEGKRTLKTYKIRAAGNGKGTVRLPKLRKGSHKIRAVYPGNQALTRSRSKAIRLAIR